MVYEYWVSTNEKEATSPHLQRETAELIETLVCSTKKTIYWVRLREGIKTKKKRFNSGIAKTYKYC